MIDRIRNDHVYRCPICLNEYDGASNREMCEHIRDNTAKQEKIVATLKAALQAALPQLIWVSKQSKGNCPDSIVRQARAALKKAGAQ